MICLHEGSIAVTWRCTGVGALGLKAPKEADRVWKEPLINGRSEGLGDYAARNWKKACGIDQGKIDI